MCAAGTDQLGAQPLLEVTVVIEPGEWIGLSLVLQSLTDPGVVESERRGVGETLRQHELRLVENASALTIDVEGTFHGFARDERHGYQRLRLQRGPGNEIDPCVEMCFVREHGLPVLDGPTGDAAPEGGPRRHDLLGPRVARQHRYENRIDVIGLVDRERVVRKKVEQGVGDHLEQGVEALLREEMVIDVGQASIGVDCLDPDSTGEIRI